LLAVATLALCRTALALQHQKRVPFCTSQEWTKLKNALLTHSPQEILSYISSKKGAYLTARWTDWDKKVYSRTALLTKSDFGHILSEYEFFDSNGTFSKNPMSKGHESSAVFAWFWSDLFNSIKAATVNGRVWRVWITGGPDAPSASISLFREHGKLRIRSISAFVSAD
jgi:hypothetical protein